MFLLLVLRDKEECPFKDTNIVLKRFTYDGGVMVVDNYGLKIIVPEGAIEYHYYVEIQVAASLLGPFIISKGYHPVSPYIWIAAGYVFKKEIRIEFQHHADISSLKDTSQLRILGCCSHHSTHHHEREWRFEISYTVCTLFTNHFCSFCLASNNDQIANRIVAYHYLPVNYESADTFRAELCFCYDVNICKEVQCS